MCEKAEGEAMETSERRVILRSLTGNRQARILRRGKVGMRGRDELILYGGIY